MLSSVLPLTRQEDSRRPVWEFADQVQITQSVLEALWKALVVPARSHDCCAPTSPYAHPRALWLRSALRCCNLSSVAAAFGEQSPHDAGHLVGESDGDQHLRLASEHLRQPRSFGRPAPANLPNHGTRSNDQQLPDCSFAAFCDGAELLLSTGRSL